MNLLKYNFWLLIVAVFAMSSCSSDDDSSTPNPIDETEDLQLIKTFTTGDHTVDIFSDSGELEVGYNQIFIRVEDPNGNYLEEAKIDWAFNMTMQMGEMEHHHGTPFGKVKKSEGKQTLYEGFVVFSMASEEPDSFWELDLEIQEAGETIALLDQVEVRSTEGKYNKRFTSVMGSDDQNYLLALVEPTKPELGANDMVVALFKQDEQGHFPIVDDYALRIDPRMPGMGNHSASGNEDLTQDEDGFYHGKVGFSMTGYWKLNLILENESGEVLKGEEVTEDNEESSLHFKLEF